MLQLVFIWINGQRLSIIIFTTQEKPVCAKVHSNDERNTTGGKLRFKKLIKISYRVGMAV